MDRHFLKCSYCERPLSVNVSTPVELGFILEQVCPLCNEKALRYMGRVQKTDLVKQHVKSACDLRCTNAVGPKCDCICSNENHGTHRLVVFNKVVGRLEVVEKDLLNDNERYLARIKRMAAAKNKIKVNVITFLTYKNRKILDWLNKGNPSYRLAMEEYHAYMTYKQFLKDIDKIEDFKSIQKKINSLSHLIPKIGDTLEYLEALSFDKEQKEQKVTV
jgi:hypothetical protein